MRVVAGVAIASMLSFTLQDAWALTGPATPPQAAAPAQRVDGGGVVGRLVPTSAVWQQAAGDRSAAVLFDGDRATSLHAEGETVLRVALAGMHPLRGVGVFGQADGMLSVYTVDRQGKTTAVAGLQDIDLRALPLRWNRFWAKQAPAVDALVLKWRPRGSGGAPLREVELLGLTPDAPAASQAPLGDRLLAGTPQDAIEAWSDTDALTVSPLEVGEAGTAAFSVGFPVDPRLVERVFLVYELRGLTHWSGAVRQVNGHSFQGGVRPELGAAGGLQVEEISPEWLFRGDNEIRFQPVDADDATGYRVRRLRLVAFARGSASLAGASGPAAASSREVAALSDGDLRTGIRAARLGKVSATLPIGAGQQPASIALALATPLSGRLTAATVTASGKVLGAEQEIDGRGLGAGWNNLPLDKLPPGAGVRLTWEAGGEGGGEIAEVRIATSPAPESRGRRVAVSTPLHGECVDHQVYVGGFVAGAEHEGQRPRLSLGRADEGLGSERPLGADGAFGVTVDEPASARGGRWTLPVRARFADGDELAVDLPIEACGDRPLAQRPPPGAGPPPLIEDEGAPFGRTIAAREGGVVDMGGVRLEIPAGALERDARITVRPLLEEQVAPADPLMTNVTVDGRAFRLGPHNLQFKKPVRLTIPYDRDRVPDELGPGELGVFYFDEGAGRWQGLPAAGGRGRGVLVAETTHFTDFIAATIARPDHPAPALSTPKMVADLKVGDPAAGVTLIQPPTASNDGAVHLKYPIEVPPGRNGMQPKLELVYDSSAGNGILGVGWSLPISHVVRDSKFGVQQTSTSETIRYLLDGEEIVPIDPLIPPSGQRQRQQYRRRVEGRFDKILRIGYSGNGINPVPPEDGGWLVTDKNGINYRYGVIEGGITTTPVIENGSEGWDRVYWGLSRVSDPHGNEIQYHWRRIYEADPMVVGIADNWNELILESIDYTHGPGVAPAFKIVLEYGQRPDPFSSARLGREIRTNKLLTGIRIQVKNSGGVLQDFRRYVFEYTAGEFGKVLLAAVSVESAGIFFYKHTFGYKTLARDAQNRVVFGNQIQWAPPLPPGIALGKGTSDSSGLNGFAGLGPTTCYPHAGFGMGGTLDTDMRDEVVADVNGDGLPDIVRNGTTYLNGFAVTGGVPDRNRGTFSTMLTQLGNIEETASSSQTMGGGVHFVGEMGVNGNWTDARSVQGKGLIDVNGDGLPDHFYGNSVKCNGFGGAVPCPGVAKTFPFASNATWSGSDASAYPATGDQDPNGAGGSTFPTQIFARWKAPFSGLVTIQAPVRRTFTVNPADPNAPAAAPVTASLYVRGYDPITAAPKERMTWSYRFERDDVSTCHPVNLSSSGTDTVCNGSLVTTGIQRFVFAGDEYYFVVGSPAGNQRNAVYWDPTITYSDAPCPNPGDLRTCPLYHQEPYGRYIHHFNMGQDLRMGGAAPAPWVTASADTRPNGNRIAVTMVKLGGIINKTFATADDVRFQVVKLTPSGGRTVVWPASGVPMQMNAAQTGTFNFDTSNVQVDVQGKWVPQEATDMWGFVRREYRLDADRLVFQVLSDSPIDPRSIDWKPTVTYQSYCYPDPADQRTKVIAGQTINADTINHICTSTPANVIGGAVTQKVEVQVPAFRYQPLTPTSASPQRTQAVHLFNDTANHTFAVAGEVEVWPGPGVDPSWQPGQDRGQVVALLQGRERLIKKEVIQLGTSGEPRFVPFQISNVPINGAEPIYFTLLVTGNHEVQWSPIVAPTGQSHQIHSATVRYLVDPPLPGQATGYPFQWTEREWLSGGFHQWTFGVYNGSYNFNTAGLRTPATYLGESHPHTAFPAVPSTTGIENPPPELPGTLPPATPLWRGKAHDDYVSPMGVFHASYFGSGSGPAFPPGAAFRRSSSHTGGGGMSAGVSLEVAYGNTYGEIGIADLNGDRVPDLLGLDRVRVGRVFIDNTLGYGTGPLGGWIRPLQAEALHATYNRTSRWGIGLGSISSQMFDKPDPKGNTKSLRSSAPSFGFGYGTSRTYADLIDINGDGLTDHVIRAPGSQILNVQLGNGYENFGFFRNGLQEWPMPSLGSWDISQSPTSHFESHFSEDEDGLRVQDNASNSLEINIMNIGGGVAFQASRTMVDMIDLNGDGLPDRVMKVPPNFVSVLPPLPGVPTGSSPLLVQWNTGLGFAAPETWVMPPWSADIENNFFTEAGLGSNDALAFNTGRTVSLTAGAVLWIPVFPIVCAIIEFGLMSTNLLNGVNAQNTQMLFQDINGDGRPDQIFKKDNLGGSPGDGVVYAKLNPIDHANLLIKVDGPLGGGFDIEYERAGNQVDIARNVDDPDNHYVMKAVTVRSQPSPGGTPRWNADPPVRTEYTYADPFYSRADRDFIGFARVTTNLPGTPDRLVVQETYDTTDVYRKGLLKKRVMRKRGSTTPASTPDDSLPVFEAEEHTWQTRQLIGPAHPIYEPRPVKFTVETNRILRSYEGSGTNPDAATVTREEIRDYENNYGNLTYFEDKGDLSTTTDDVRYTIGYHEDTTRYIFKPNSVVARNSSGAKIAQRTATYHATHGKLLTTTDLLVGGRRPSDGATYNGDAAANPTPNPVWTFTYDQLGVVQTITDPSVRPGPPASNYVISVNFTDPITRATPVTMQDSFGYVWTQEHDARTGLPTRTIDFNDVVLDRQYDMHGRLHTIFSGPAPATQRIHQTYFPMGDPQSNPDQPARVVTSYFNAESSATLSLVDGWGRVIQTKKKAEVDNGSGTGVPGLVVSGRIAHDARGRLASQGQPFFTAGQSVFGFPTFQAPAPLNPTTFSYDVLGRRTSINHPGGRPPTTTAYDLATLNMTLRRRQTDSDSNANSSGVYPGKPVRTYRNARGLVVAVEQQNTVGSPATLKTLTTTYAYDPLDRLREVRDAKPTTATPPGPNVTTIAWDTMGRMISLTSPDNGQTLYDYDLAGNLGRKQNAKGNLVRYNYDYHRLRGIDYPSPGTADVTLSYYESTEPPGMRGRLRSRTDEAGAETFQYDTHGNVSQTSWTPAGQPAPVPPPTVTSYNYDFMGVLRSLTVPGETLTYSYNSAGQVTGVSGESPGSNVVYALNVLYNEFGQRTQMVTAGTTKYTYDPVTRRLKNLDSTAGNPLQRLIYDYDFVGNVKRLRNAVTFPGGTSPVIPGPTDQTFVYDHLHQLTGATGTYTGVGSLGGRTYSLTITYNEIGNIIRKNQLLQNRATVGGTNQTVSSYNDVYSYASAARPHAPSSIGGASATYDADGNQLTFASTPSRTMTWSEDDRLKSFTRGSTSQTYLYRADGQRAIKRTPSAFHYANPFYVNRPGMQSTRHVMLGNERIASVITQAGATSGQTVYYHGDHLQSSHYTLDGNGNPVQHNEYIPTGETWLDEIASGQSSKRVPYLFNSKELDESGLYYMDARYYDPRYSMWMSTDPALRSYAGGSPNGGLTNPRNLGLYGYSYNNPVAFRDPTGLSPALAEKAYREGLASPPPRRGSRGGTAAAWAALSNRPPEQVASEPVDYASMSSSMPMSCADCDRGEDVAPLPRGAAELEPSKLDTTPIRERNVTLKGGGAMKGIPGVEGNVIVNISRHGIAVGLEGEFSLGSGFDSGMSFGAETSDYYPTTGVSFPKFGDSAEISFGPFGIKVPNRRSTAGSVDPGFLGSLRKGRLPGGLGAWSPVVTATWLAW